MAIAQNDRLDETELAEALSRIEHERNLKKAGFAAIVLLAAASLFAWVYLSYNSASNRVSPGLIGEKSMEGI